MYKIKKQLLDLSKKWQINNSSKNLLKYESSIQRLNDEGLINQNHTSNR